MKGGGGHLTIAPRWRGRPLRQSTGCVGRIAPFHLPCQWSRPHLRL